MVIVGVAIVFYYYMLQNKLPLGDNIDSTLVELKRHQWSYSMDTQTLMPVNNAAAQTMELQGSGGATVR